MNYEADPLGIQSAPHFGWGPGVAVQSGYEIKVTALSAAGAPRSVVWDSGVVSAPADVDVAYQGKALQSGTRYDWAVRTRDGSGRLGPWSRPSWFGTGLLNPSDWSGQWIGGPSAQDRNWTGLTETVGFTIPQAGESAGAGFLFRAQPAGKTWGEACDWKLSVAAAASTALAAPAAGDGNVKLASVAGLAPGRQLAIGTTADQETAAIASVGTAVTATTLASAAAGGDDVIRVTSTGQIAVGDAITIGSGASAETATIASAGTAGAAGTGLTLTGPLASAQAAGAQVADTGSGVTLTAALVNPHLAGEAVTAAASPQLAGQVQHYSKAVIKNSGQNGEFPPAVVSATLATVPAGQLATAGLTLAAFAGQQHRIVISYQHGTITTAIDGTTLNMITPAAGITQPDGYGSIEKSGTIGFSSGSQVTVADVSVTGSGSPGFSTDFAGGANPFQSGDVTSAGLVSPGVVTADSPSHDVMLPLASPAPLLRGQFTALRGHGPVVRARLYVAACGWPDMTLNGQQVTDAHLYPDRSQSNEQILYDTFDVTRLVSGGQNVLGAQLGRGFCACTTPDEWLYQEAPADTRNPSMLAQLEVTYADGTTQTIATSQNWKEAPGSTVFDDVYTGEDYDARLLPAGWDTSHFDAAGWATATVLSASTGYSTETGQPVPATLAAQEDPNVTVVRTLKPVSITQVPATGPDTYVLDFGQIASGWPHLTVEGKRGTTVMMDYDESLNADGTVHQGVGATFIDGRYSTSYYTLSGDGTEQWSPSFSYTGFRYVEVTGPPKAPTLADPEVTMEVARTSNPVTATVTTSNALLNKIVQNAKWSEWNNTVETESDTPDREKNGWTGDAQISSLSELLENNDVAFDTQYLTDLINTQTGPGPYGGIDGGGQYSFIAPNSAGEYGTADTPGWNAADGPNPEWDAAAFVYPWEMYQQYGDTHGTLNSVSATMKTASGKITSAWTRLPDNQIELKVTIPDNTTATVWVPTQGQVVTAPAGARYLGQQTIGATTALGGQPSQYAVYQVSPGTWEWNPA